MTLDQLAAFFGWMTVLNIGFLALAWLFVWLEWPWITMLVQRVFPLPEEKLDEVYLRWLAQYELFIYVFNLIPWLALKIVQAP